MKWLSYQRLRFVASKQSTTKEVMPKTSLYLFIAVLCSLLIKPGFAQNGAPSPTLCTDADCSCDPHPSEPDLIKVTCRCQPKKVLKVGGHSNHHNALSVPENASSLNLTDCHHVEVFARTFNHVAGLKNVTISGSRKVVLHTGMYKSRNGAGSGKPPSFALFEITDVHQLDVKRHAFEGIKIDGSFTLNKVTMEKVPSLAFDFDSVHEFNIVDSRFDRIAMRGIKVDNCHEFNVYGGSKFFSLASNAFEMRCNKFMLVYNTFDSLLDASLNVKSAVIDIQGNTFVKLTGKPFIRLATFSKKEMENYQQPSQAGFIFRENKFAADPILPFNALAMPAFDLLTESHVVMIEQNHFLCDCNKVAWFIGAMTYGFDRSVIANGRGSLDFLQQLYRTSGQCLKCNLMRCEPIQDQSFRDFASSALIKHENKLKCSASGQPLRSHKPGGGYGFDEESGRLDEEDLAQAKNCELNGSCRLPITQAGGAHSINIKVTEKFFTTSCIMFAFSIIIARRMVVSVE